MKIRTIEQRDDKTLAKIIRDNLSKYNLAIKGTVFFDPELDRLSEYYFGGGKKREYYVLVDDKNFPLGGIGFEKTDGFTECVELQKIYLAESVKGKGYGKLLLTHLIKKVREYGYKRIYLETHTNLSVAIELYKKFGFIEIEKPKFVNHSAMNRFFMLEL